MRERGTALARRGEDTVGTGLPHMVVQCSRGGGHFTTRENVEASGGRGQNRAGDSSVRSVPSR